VHRASGSLNVSSVGLGSCKVAGLFHGCSWDEARDNQHSLVRAQWDPATHYACSFPVVVEGGVDAGPGGTYELGQKAVVSEACGRGPGFVCACLQAVTSELRGNMSDPRWLSEVCPGDVLGCFLD